MRIGFVSLWDAADVTSWSGIPFQVLNEMRAQRADVRVLSPLNSRAKYLATPVRLWEKAHGRSVTLNHFPVVLRDYGRQIEAFVKQQGIDIVFSTSTVPVTMVDCDKPIITWTDAVFHAMQGYYSKAFSKLSAQSIRRGMRQEEMALRNCSLAVFASKWAMEGARRLTDEKKLRVLSFGSSLPVHHTMDDVARWAAEKRKKRRHQCELLFVGVNWERKGGRIAVETARLLNEAGIETKLRVVGSQPDGPVPDFVDVLGFINKSSEAGLRRITELFQSADFFILPTTAEAAGIVFSEASSYGVPSLAYATGGVTDYVQNGVNGFCFESGAGADVFASEVQRVLADPREYEQLSLQAFDEYRNRLNWATSVRRLLEFCKECGRATHNPVISTQTA